jgi:hypothetical protein
VSLARIIHELVWLKERRQPHRDRPDRGCSVPLVNGFGTGENDAADRRGR